MQRATMVSLLLALVLARPGASAARSLVSPVTKVVQMLTGMLEKGKKELHEEQVMYSAYKQFCDDTTAEKAKAVDEASAQIDMLKADIQLADTTGEELAKKIQSLDNSVATWHGDIKAATAAREIERADYTAIHKDYTESVDAITKAIEVIKAQAFSRPQAALLEQRLRASSAVALKPARRVIDAFLSSEEDPALPAGEPDAHAYEFQSSGIIDMLDKLHDKFLDERTGIEKEEMNKRHAHDLLLQDLKKSIVNAGNTRTEKVQQKAKELQSSATMKGALGDTTTTKADDQKYLTDLTATCGQKASDYTERQKMRQDELSALEKAVEILSSAGVTPALLQRTASVAFVQKHSEEHSADQLRVAAYLHERAGQINSQVLSAIAVRVQDDPFVKVKKMIQGLITRLMEEAGEEAEHKGWCDSEIEYNTQVRTSRSTQVESLASQIDQKKSFIAKSSNEITELTQQVADFQAEVAQQTKLRQAEKKQNEATIKDSQQAQTAVQQALIVLKEFYGAAAEATAFVQDARRSQQAPEIFDSPYTGMGGESGGVIAMLEVIESDYARLESSTAAMEATGQSDFDKSMSDTAVAKAQAQKDIEHKTHARQTNEQALLDLGNDLNSAQKELDAATVYYEKLKPSCMDAGMSFSERGEKRQEEIQSLQEALRILNGEDIA